MKYIKNFIIWLLFLVQYNCQVIEDTIEKTPDQRDSKRIETIQTSTRSVFRVRPFQGTSTTISTLQNELSDDPIPTKVWIPAGLDFSCKKRAPGYYTDPSPLSKCQVYHMCMPDGRKYSMLCGIGTIFNQITFVCDHWYNYQCSDAESDYKRNDQLWDQFLSPLSTKDSSSEYDYDEPLPTLST